MRTANLPLATTMAANPTSFAILAQETQVLDGTDEFAALELAFASMRGWSSRSPTESCAIPTTPKMSCRRSSCASIARERGAYATCRLGSRPSPFAWRSTASASRKRSISQTSNSPAARPDAEHVAMHRQQIDRVHRLIAALRRTCATRWCSPPRRVELATDRRRSRHPRIVGARPHPARAANPERQTGRDGNKTMNHDEHLDNILDEALSEYREAEPLAGLEDRGAAATARPRAPVPARKWLRWGIAVACLAALAMVIWIGMARRTPQTAAPAGEVAVQPKSSLQGTRARPLAQGPVAISDGSPARIVVARQARRTAGAR